MLLNGDSIETLYLFIRFSIVTVLCITIIICIIKAIKKSFSFLHIGLCVICVCFLICMFSVGKTAKTNVDIEKLCSQFDYMLELDCGGGQVTENLFVQFYVDSFEDTRTDEQLLRDVNETEYLKTDRYDQKGEINGVKYFCSGMKANADAETLFTSGTHTGTIFLKKDSVVITVIYSTSTDLKDPRWIFYYPAEKNADISAYLKKAADMEYYECEYDTAFYRIPYELFKENIIPAEDQEAVAAENCTVLEIINKYGVTKEQLASVNRTHYDNFGVYYFTQQQIDALYSENWAEYFITPYGFIAGDKIITPKWLAEHSAEDYIKAKITKNMIWEKYDKIISSMTHEQKLVFDNKIKAL